MVLYRGREKRGKIGTTRIHHGLARLQGSSLRMYPVTSAIAIILTNCFIFTS